MSGPSTSSNPTSQQPRGSTGGVPGKAEMLFPYPSAFAGNGCHGRQQTINSPTRFGRNKFPRAIKTILVSLNKSFHFSCSALHCGPRFKLHENSRARRRKTGFSPHRRPSLNHAAVSTLRHQVGISFILIRIDCM